MKKDDRNTVFTPGGVPVKIRKKLGIGFIIASFFFLFNPDLNVIDILPDFIGYILICMGLSQLSYINSSFEEAAEKFKKMILVSFCKFASIVLLFGLLNERERPYGFLLFAFSFLVLDLIFLIPAVKCLFEGFIYLAGRHKSEVAYKRKPAFNPLNKLNTEGLDSRKKERIATLSKKLNRFAEMRKTYIEKIYRSTFVFFVVKAVGYTLPEFTVLTKDSYTDGSFVMYMYDNISNYRILSMMIVSVFGLVWLIRSVKFFVKLGNESSFIESLKEDFVTKALPREGIFVRRTVKNALLLFGLGAIFSIDFHVSITLDSISSSAIAINEITLNVFPDIITAFLFLCAAITLRHYIKAHKQLIVSSSVYFAMSAFASILKIYFLSAYGSFSAVNRADEAFILFYSICASTIIENIAFIAMMICFAKLMIELIKNYTGYISVFTDYTSQSRLKAIHKELNLKVWVIVAVAVLSAATASLYDFMLIERHTFAQITWVIDFAVQAAFAGTVIYALFGIKDEVDSRYMLA